jgi:hypothetical protein
MLPHIIYVTLVTVMIMLILLVWRIGFGVTGMEFVGVMPTVQGFAQILGSVHGATTHENNTTMSLYGYGLA